MAEKQTDVVRTEEKTLARSGTRPLARNPFQVLERFAEEMDRVFDDFGFGRHFFAPRVGLAAPRAWHTEEWLPDVEVLQRKDELVIRTDLPGLDKDHVKVNVTEDMVTIEGERKHEQKEEKEGVYRSERSYGKFYRSIGLPEGAITDQAKATFKDGVLEITMPAPPESVKHGRRLEIADTATVKK